jgi:hypothetical protein
MTISHLYTIENSGFGVSVKLSYHSGNIWYPLSGEYVHVFYKRVEEPDSSYVKAGDILTFQFSFEIQPKPLNLDPMELIKKNIAKQITVRESVMYPSNVNNKYVDEFDLRAIDGIVVRYNYGKRANGTNWAVYSITDMSAPAENEVTPDGKIIPSTLTVWVPYQLLKWDKDSEVMVVGTVQIGGNGEPFMNAILVYPIYAIPLMISEEAGSVE